MLPSFDIEGGVLLALARGVSVAALLSVLGTLTFRTFVAPRVLGRMPHATADRIARRLLRMARIGVAIGIVAIIAWLVLQTADIASATSVLEVARALPLVVAGTEFGHLVLLQIVALVAVALALGRRDDVIRQRIAFGFAVIATALHAGHSHAASMYSGPSLLLASDVLHLLGAGAWLGGLPPLLMMVREAPPGAGALAARWFSPLGKLCLVVMTATAAFQGWVMIASVPGLVGTAYGWMAMVKLALFGVLFGFALANRYRFAPALLRSDPEGARRVLARSIAVQTGFGLAVVAAAAVLSSLPPAMHVQPVWPFADRLTLDTIGEDPAFRNEAISAALALAGAAVLLVVAALVRRRVRWLIAIGAVAIAWFAVPHLDLLFVPAYPTSYFHSPTNFAASAIVAGAALYPRNCAACHGGAGRGDGPAAKALPVPPADLTASHLWMHSDGELFWWLSHGIAAPDGGPAMPGFAGTLSEDERWALIDYIRARNAGFVFHGSREWSPPLQAPELQADCMDGRKSLADLRGGFVRLVFASSASASDPGVTTILATSGAAAQPAPGLCIARDEILPRAYAIVSGLEPEELAGVQFLIDGAGWLRALQRPGAAPAWNDPGALAAEIQQLKAHPIAGDAGSHMQMEM